MLGPLSQRGLIELPYVPKECCHNAHMFYIKTESNAVQDGLLAFLKKAGIGAVFHYIPLHSSQAGQKFGRFCGEDKFTTVESQRLIRLPIYYGMDESDIDKVVCSIFNFFA